MTELLTGKTSVDELHQRVDELERQLTDARRAPAADQAGRSAALNLAVVALARDIGVLSPGPVEADLGRRLQALADDATDLAAHATPSTSTRQARRSHAPLVRTALAQGMTLAGVLLVVFVLFQLVATDLIHARGQRELANGLETRLLAAGASALAGDGSAGPGEGFEGFDVAGGSEAGVYGDQAPADGNREPRAGDPIAALSIPAIDLHEVVVAGSGATQLKFGPGHYRSSSIPGYIGNSVLAGHRVTYGAPFRELDRLEAGDKITVTTVDGIFRYEVREQVEIEPGEDDVTGPKFENLLTLVTSAPEYRASRRLAVIAELTSAPVVPDEEALLTRNTAVAADELGIYRDTTAWTPAVIALQCVVVLWGGALVLRRRWRPWSTWLIAGPPLVAAAWVFFESASRLLPSTF